MNAAPRRRALPGRWWHRARRRPHPVRPVPARLQAARRPARRSASCASARATRWCSPPTAAPRASASTRSRRSRCNHFYPGSSVSVVRHRRLQPGVQVLPELGHLASRREMDRLMDQASARGDRRRAAERAGCQSVAFTYNDPVIFAEYAMDTADACHARGMQDRGGDRRLHPRRAAARVLRQDGRRQRRPEGASPTTSTSSSPARTSRRCSTRCSYIRARDRRAGSRSPRC
ncbi:MAG: hypothetical protein MZW92_48310 [Comamonadaceae bacterium]|nr:hypothetical protein [Comamonadaceae bacterium]